MSKKDSARRGLIRQGDLLLVPVAELPDRTHRLHAGRLVLAEGEATGHAHVVDDERASLHSLGGSKTWFLSVEEGEPVLLVHEEHDALEVNAGVYEVRRQREYEPTSRRSWRAVSD